MPQNSICNSLILVLADLHMLMQGVALGTGLVTDPPDLGLSAEDVLKPAVDARSGDGWDGKEKISLLPASSSVLFSKRASEECRLWTKLQ